MATEIDPYGPGKIIRRSDLYVAKNQYCFPAAQSGCRSYILNYEIMIAILVHFAYNNDT